MKRQTRLKTSPSCNFVKWSFVELECNNLHAEVSMFFDGWTCSGVRTCSVFWTCVCFSVKWIYLLQWIRLLIRLSVSTTVSRKRSVSHYHVLLFSFVSHVSHMVQRFRQWHLVHIKRPHISMADPGFSSGMGGWVTLCWGKGKGDANLVFFVANFLPKTPWNREKNWSVLTDRRYQHWHFEIGLEPIFKSQCRSSGGSKGATGDACTPSQPKILSFSWSLW